MCMYSGVSTLVSHYICWQCTPRLVIDMSNFLVYISKIRKGLRNVHGVILALSARLSCVNYTYRDIHGGGC